MSTSTGPNQRTPKLTLARVAVWVVVGAIGTALFVSGVIGILVKG